MIEPTTTIISFARRPVYRRKRMPNRASRQRNISSSSPLCKSPIAARRAPRETSSHIFVADRKLFWGLPCGKLGFTHILRTRPVWPQRILFGQVGFMILRCSGCDQPCQSIAVVPRHPLRRVRLQLLGVDPVKNWRASASTSSKAAPAKRVRDSVRCLNK